MMGAYPSGRREFPPSPTPRRNRIARGGGLLVDHADGGLVGDRAGNGGSRGIARNGDKCRGPPSTRRSWLPKASRWSGNRKKPRPRRILVFGDQDERAGQVPVEDAMMPPFAGLTWSLGMKAPPWCQERRPVPRPSSLALRPRKVAHSRGRGGRQVDDAERN